LKNYWFFQGHIILSCQDKVWSGQIMQRIFWCFRFKKPEWSAWW